MGASTSTPAPLLEIDTLQGKVFIPSSFTVQPKLLPRNPPASPALAPPYPHRPRPRAHFHGPGPAQHYPGLARRGGGGPESESTHTSDASTLADLDMPSRSPRVGRMGLGRGGGGMDGGAGGGMGRRGYLERGLDGGARPRSAPEMVRGGARGRYPGMMGNGMMGNGMMGNGMMPPPGLQQQQQQHPLSGMPPAYTTHPSMPHLPVGAMNMNPYPAGYPGGGPNHGPGPGPAPPPAPTSTSSTTSTAPPPPHAQPRRRGSGRRYEHVPMGAYASTTEKPKRQRGPQTSARLNKGQSSERKVGPSGKEWIDGDAFLDACICTTGCDCRKNQRVLYRAQHDRPRRAKGSEDDSEDEGDEYGSGEIRYILKEDLGRDCGDHSGCRKDKSKKSESSESGSEVSKKETKKKKTKKEKRKEEKKRKESFKGLKDDLLEALDSRLHDMTKASQYQQPTSTTPPQPPPPFGGPGMGPSAFTMGGPHHMDPRIAQQMGMMGGDGYRMGVDMPGRMPPGMSDPTGKRGMQYQSMGMGMDMDMGGGGMADFDHDVSEMGRLGMGMPSPYAMPAGMQNHKAGLRRNLMSHGGGARAGGARRFGGGPAMDPMAAVHAAPGRGGRGRGMLRGHLGGGARAAAAQPYSESDDVDFGPPGPSIRSSGMQRHGAAYHRPGGPRDRRRNNSSSTNDSSSAPPRRHKSGASSPQRNAAAGSVQDGGKQPRVDTDDDEAY